MSLPLGASRVAQLDAFMLDRELSKIIAVRVTDALDKLSPGLGSEYSLEIEASVDAAILSSTILKNRPTPGMRLNNLMFGSAASRRVEKVSFYVKLAYIVCTVMGTWIWSRLKECSEKEQWSCERIGWKRKAARLIRVVDRGLSLVIALNMIAFLQYGNYRDVLERLLRMRLVPIRERAQNPVQFSNQNLQLMSSTLSEMMFFVIPLVNWTRIRVFTSFATGFVLRHGTWLVRVIKTHVSGYIRSLLLLDSEEEEEEDDNNKVVDEGKQSKEHKKMMRCAVCGTSSVVMAHRGSQCDHIFCYVCVYGLVSECTESGISARCPRCHCNLSNIIRHDNCFVNDDDHDDDVKIKENSSSSK